MRHPTKKETRPSRLIFRIVLIFAIRFLFMVRFTLRFKNRIMVETPCVIAVFHGEMLPVLDCMKNTDSVFLASANHLGFSLSRVLLSWGYGIVYGSPGHGGKQALQELEEQIEMKRNVVIAPDGSRGPCHKMKSGAVILAKRKKVPLYLIVPEYKGIRVKFSWDNFLYPIPFSKVKFRCAKIEVDPELSEEQTANMIKKAEALLQN